MDNQQHSLPGIEVETVEVLDQSHAAERFIWEQHLGDVPFGEVYLALLGEGWYWRDAAIIAWMAMPKDMRVPATKGDLANLLGCGLRTVHRRCRENPAIAERATMFTLQRLAENTGEIVDALIKSATNPNYKNHPDRKLALEMAGAYRPKQGFVLDSNWEDGDLSAASEDELLRMAQLSDGQEDDDD